MPAIGMKLKQAKGLFFDRQPVLNAVSRSERRVLSKFGAFVRRGARSSIRKRKSVSEPGRPPSSHTGLLRKMIFFVYEPATGFGGDRPRRIEQGHGGARLLEHGGSVVRRKGKQRVRMTYRPRPFMGPAFERELPQLPALWRDSVR